VKIGPALEGAPSLFSVAFDLASVGYSVHEHVVSGKASAFTEVVPRTPDGCWEVEPSGTAEFATRLVVYRPNNPARANGTVIVEWLNVTGGIDVPAVWMPTHRHLLREGYTWVGVSAQLVSIDGGGMMPGLGLKQTAPERYDALVHPGDAYAFDIFTQVGRAVHELLTDRYGVHVERVLATGASQSAFHLTTYVNAVDPLEGVFDGFLLQGRGGAGAPIEGWGAITFEPTEASMTARRERLAGRDHIRVDGRAPVIVVQSETDVFGHLGYLPARQWDNPRFRLWEVAGAAHCDTYFLCAAALDSGSLSPQQLAGLLANAEQARMSIEVPINSGPQMHYVLQRAIDALDKWVRDGTAPPHANRIEVGAGGGIAVDDVGVARGGVRTPWVDAPAAILSGLGQPGDMTELFGTTRPIDPAAFAARYPGGDAERAERFVAATRDAVEAGFLLPVDAPEIEALGLVTLPA
jgi:hypothetical protein